MAFVYTRLPSLQKMQDKEKTDENNNNFILL